MFILFWDILWRRDWDKSRLKAFYCKQMYFSAGRGSSERIHTYGWIHTTSVKYLFQNSVAKTLTAQPGRAGAKENFIVKKITRWVNAKSEHTALTRTSFLSRGKSCQKRLLTIRPEAVS